MSSFTPRLAAGLSARRLETGGKSGIRPPPERQGARSDGMENEKTIAVRDGARGAAGGGVLRALWRLLPMAPEARGRFASRLFAAAPFLFTWSDAFRRWRLERPAHAATGRWTPASAVKAWKAEGRRQRAIAAALAAADEEDGVIDDLPANALLIPNDSFAPLRWRGRLAVHLALSDDSRRAAFFRALDRIPAPFDLFVAADAPRAEIEAYFAPLSEAASVTATPFSASNAPLAAFAETLSGYDIVMHLTAKSAGAAARRADNRLHHLLHSRAHAAHLLNAFADSAETGAIHSGAESEAPFFIARGALVTRIAAGERLSLAAQAAGLNLLEARSEKRASLSTAFRTGGARYRSGAFEAASVSGDVLMPSFPSGVQARIAIFTCATGGYDQPLPYESFVDGAAYRFFTDAPRDAGFWRTAPLAIGASDPVKAARFHKTQPHVVLPDADIAVWIDGNISIVGDIAPYIRRVVDAGASFGRVAHPWRATIGEEADLIDALELENPEVVRAQLAAQRAEGYADQDGLTETNFLIMDLRRPETRAALDLWRRQIETFSRRDQLSFDYARWKAGASAVSLFDDGVSVRNNPDFAYFAHGGWDHPYRKRLGDIVRGPAQSPAAPLRAKTARRRGDGEARSADIIVCVHNAPADVAACLAALERTRTEKTRLILVDDGSAEETAALARDHARRRPEDILIRHEEAQGYTKAANAGLRRSDRDYAILLNSDTIPAAGWIEAMLLCGESDAAAGLIGPLSNAASWQSVPEVVGRDGDFAVNDLPAGWSIEDLGALCASLSRGAAVDAAVLNGFCLAIKRAVIEKTGYLDDALFPQGYGEETDYTFRAADAGFSCLVATGAYVFHAKSKSFTHERRRVLSRAGFEAVVARHSKARVDRAVEFMKKHHRLAALRQDVAARLQGPPPAHAPATVAPARNFA